MVAEQSWTQDHVCFLGVGCAHVGAPPLHSPANVMSVNFHDCVFGYMEMPIQHFAFFMNASTHVHYSPLLFIQVLHIIPLNVVTTSHAIHPPTCMCMHLLNQLPLNLGFVHSFM